MKTDPRRVATADHRDADPIVADATRLFGLTHRGLKPTATITRPLRGRLCDTDRSPCGLERDLSDSESIPNGLNDDLGGLVNIPNDLDDIPNDINRVPSGLDSILNRVYYENEREITDLSLWSNLIKH